MHDHYIMKANGGGDAEGTGKRCSSRPSGTATPPQRSPLLPKSCCLSCFCGDGRGKGLQFYASAAIAR